MNDTDKLNETIRELCSYKTEKEWFESKLNWFNANELGEYISALSNSAFLCKRRIAYSVWGLNDKTHEIEETTFDFDMDACREATIDAFLHNDWTTGNEPMFTAYSNRIEILSRGSIPQNLMSFTLGPLLHSQMESSPWHLDARQ